MAEYINREALEADLNIRLSMLRDRNGYYDHYTDGFDECVDRVENFPAADVAPVKHGKWEQRDYFDEDSNVYVCSVCDEPWTLNAGNPKENNMKHCPNCGAKMEL